MDIEQVPGDLLDEIVQSSQLRVPVDDEVKVLVVGEVLDSHPFQDVVVGVGEVLDKHSLQDVVVGVGEDKHPRVNFENDLELKAELLAFGCVPLI